MVNLISRWWPLGSRNRLEIFAPWKWTQNNCWWLWWSPERYEKLEYTFQLGVPGLFLRGPTLPACSLLAPLDLFVSMSWNIALHWVWARGDGLSCIELCWVRFCWVPVCSLNVPLELFVSTSRHWVAYFALSCVSCVEMIWVVWIVLSCNSCTCWQEPSQYASWRRQGVSVGGLGWSPLWSEERQLRNHEQYVWKNVFKFLCKYVWNSFENKFWKYVPLKILASLPAASGSWTG